MELLCRQRAKADSHNSWKWLARADRWADVAHQEIASRFQQRHVQQQMHAGPMAMGPNTIKGDLRNLQQG
jgi:hypothetical protein